MNAEIISVGTELLLGDIVNTNARFLSQSLAGMGIDVFYQSSVGDNPLRLKRVLASAISRSNIIILTGGLGPTQDDLTVQTVSDTIGVKLVLDQKAAEHIKECFKKLSREFTENNLKQAMVPNGAEVFLNRHGTAPGCAIAQGEQVIIMLPGPPVEMEAMFNEYVVDYLSKYSSDTIVSHFVNIYGVGESKVAEIVADLLESSNPTVAPYAKESEVALRVTAKADDKSAADAMCREMIDTIVERLTFNIYGVDKASLQDVAVELLKSKKFTLSTAESCTAGLISKRITDIPGSSEVFNMGVAVYSNESKEKMLNIPASVIEKHGAVSPQVAVLMAKAVRDKSGSDIGLSITGIAGPDSDNTNKPVGLSYIAIADKFGEYVIECRKAEYHDREYIRNASASEAINFLRLYLMSYPDKVKGIELYNMDELNNGGLNTDTKEDNKIDLSSIVIPTNHIPAISKDDVMSSIAKMFGENTVENASKMEELSVPFDGLLLGEDDDNSPEPEDDVFNDSDDGLIVDTQYNSDLDDMPDVVETQQHIALDNSNNDYIDDIFKSIDDNLKKQDQDIDIEQNTNTQQIDISSFANEKIIDAPVEVPVDVNTDNDIVPSEQAVVEEQDDDKGTHLEPKKAWYIRLLTYFLPWKGDPKKEIARKSVFLVALITLIVLVFQLIPYFVDPLTSDMLGKELQNIYKPAPVAAMPYASSVRNPRFNELYNKNSDTIGWISIGNTKVNNPVVQAKDNDFYLRRNFEKKYNRYGTLYADYKSDISFDNQSKNIVIYGHNMRDNGSMFGQLPNYRNLDFYKQNPVITFDTLYRDGKWKVFAVITTNAFKAQDNGNVFPYRKSDFESEQDFNTWINESYQRSSITTGVDVNFSDDILTLQTCVYEFSEARLVIMARRVRDGESAEVDVSAAKLNKDVIYPQAWYDKKGIPNPHKNADDTTAPPTSNVGGTPGASSTAATTIATTQMTSGSADTTTTSQRGSSTTTATGGNTSNTATTVETTVATTSSTSTKATTTVTTTHTTTIATTVASTAEATEKGADE